MIKLNRNFTPIFFSVQNISLLTLSYRTDDKHVWQHQDVKDACLQLGNNKCAYCEVELNQKSTYLEIEHFKHKNDYPDEVIKWENLLPSCRHCNGTKSNHDVVAEPIINPCTDLPSEHLYLQAYRIKGKSPLGVMTTEVLNLNDIEHYVVERCKVGTLIFDKIEEAENKFINYKANQIPARKREVNKIVRALLNQCQKTELFSAVSATILHESEGYKMLRSDMMAYGIWSEQFEIQHQTSLVLKLSISKY